MYLTTSLTRKSIIAFPFRNICCKGTCQLCARILHIELGKLRGTPLEGANKKRLNQREQQHSETLAPNKSVTHEEWQQAPP